MEFREEKRQRPESNSGDNAGRDGNERGAHVRPRFSKTTNSNPVSSSNFDKPRFDKPRENDSQQRPYNRDNNSQSGGYQRPTYNRDNNNQGSGGYSRPYNRDNNSSAGGSSPRPYNRDNNGGGGGYSRPYNRDGNSSQGGGYQRPAYNRDNNDSSQQRPAYNRDNNSGGGYGNRPYNRDASNDQQRRPYNNNNDSRPSYNREGNDSRPSYNREGSDQARRPYNREGGYQGNSYNREGGQRPYQNRPYNNNRSGGTSQGGGYSNSYQNGYNQGKPYDQPMVSSTEPIRLNKFLANAGICSRREADEYIQAGVVTVNGVVVQELGVKVLPTDKIMFHDQTVQTEKKIYILLNKPKDFVTTVDDPKERNTVLDLVRNACRERIYPVGRLDRSTTGVLLLTNDGDLASKLTHPKYNKKKIYHVYLDKPLTKADMEQIATGIELEDGEIHADAVHYVEDDDRNQIGIEIHSGRNRIVRRIFDHLGYRVKRLDRVFFAGLTKKNLPRGKWRFLSQTEVNMLRMGAFE